MSKTRFYSLKKMIGFGTVVSSAILNAYGSETFLERSVPLIRHCGHVRSTGTLCWLRRRPSRVNCNNHRARGTHARHRECEQFCARTDREVDANADAPFSLNFAAPNTLANVIDKAKTSSIKNVASSHFAGYAASDCDASGQSAAGGVRRRSGSGVVFGNGVPHSAGAKEKARRENGKALRHRSPRASRGQAGTNRRRSRKRFE